MPILLVVISFVAIVGYFIGVYCWLFYWCLLIIILLVIILLVVIGSYSISGY